MREFKGVVLDKFLVLKNEDIRVHLSAKEKDILGNLIEKVCDGRHKEGKSWSNQYLVINTDEPYAEEIVEILKKNGHWG